MWPLEQVVVVVESSRFRAWLARELLLLMRQVIAASSLLLLLLSCPCCSAFVLCEVCTDHVLVGSWRVVSCPWGDTFQVCAICRLEHDVRSCSPTDGNVLCLP